MSGRRRLPTAPSSARPARAGRSANEDVHRPTSARLASPRRVRRHCAMHWSVRLYAYARQHRNVFALRWAPQIGATPATVDPKARRERWPRPYEGVVLTPGATWDHLTDLIAVQAALRCDAAARGPSAAWLFGLARRPPARPHLLLPHHQRTIAEVGFTRRSRHVTAADRTLIKGVVTLTPCFWLISSAADLGTDALFSFAVDARQRGLIDIGAIAARLEPMPRVAGRSKLTAVLRQLAHDGSDSVLESRVRDRLIAAGFAPSLEPVPVLLASGRTVHLDIAFPAERVAIECMGFIAHSSRRQLNTDALRENAIALASDWLVLKLTWDRYMHDWDGFVSELRRALTFRRRALG